MSHEQSRAIILKQVLKVWKLMEIKIGIHHADAHLSHLHLLEAIDNALIDLRRMSKFHQTPGKLPDRHKYAGFVSKWIAKVRPIQFATNKPLNLTNKLRLDLNAAFTVFIMQSFLKTDIPLTIAEHLRYWFIFRDERGETLAMIAYCSEEMGRTRT